MIAPICTLTHEHARTFLTEENSHLGIDRILSWVQYYKQRIHKDCVYSSVVSQASHSVTYQGHITSAFTAHALATRSHSQIFVLLHEIWEGANVQRDEPERALWSPTPTLVLAGLHCARAYGTCAVRVCSRSLVCGHL